MSEVPKLFIQDKEIKEPITDLKQLIFKPKDKSNYFNNYKTSYPFNHNKVNEILNTTLHTKDLIFHEQFMLWYDGLYEKYIESFNNLFTKSVNITDISWKYYLAIMAVSTIKSEYLLSLLENQFLYFGGEESWVIGGLDYVNEKLRCLAKINNILAFQPWKINSMDLKEVLQLWNKEELLEALLILVFFQRQAFILESLKLRIKESENEQEVISDLILSKQNKVGTQLFECLTHLNETESDSEVIKEKETSNKNINVDNKLIKVNEQTTEVLPTEHLNLIEKSKFYKF